MSESKIHSAFTDWLIAKFGTKIAYRVLAVECSLILAFLVALMPLFTLAHFAQDFLRVLIGVPTEGGFWQEWYSELLACIALIRELWDTK